MLVIADDVVDDASGVLLAALTSTLVLRGGGGFRGPSRLPTGPAAIPESPAQYLMDLPGPLERDPIVLTQDFFSGR